MYDAKKTFELYPETPMEKINYSKLQFVNKRLFFLNEIEYKITLHTLACLYMR